MTHSGTRKFAPLRGKPVRYARPFARPIELVALAIVALVALLAGIGVGKAVGVGVRPRPPVTTTTTSAGGS